MGDKALCDDCWGRGRTAAGVCVRCNGKGCVCPHCRGLRFVRQRQRQYAAWQADVIRCPVCCEGNNVNEMAEIRAIQRYIALADAQADAQ